jgi:hypothetical protein
MNIDLATLDEEIIVGADVGVQLAYLRLMRERVIAPFGVVIHKASGLAGLFVLQ